jgi:hypothetical protein
MEFGIEYHCVLKSTRLQGAKMIKNIFTGYIESALSHAEYNILEDEHFRAESHPAKE